MSGNALAIIGGGPSAADTLHEAKGKLAAINASHDWLLGKGITPWACGVVDRSPRIAGMITPQPGVAYYIADTAAPNLVAKLRGCDVRRWRREDTAGCSMGLRWIGLGFALGFRRFDLHGFDSSFRNGATHAYPDRRDAKRKGVIRLRGYETRINYIAQIIDFFRVVKAYPECEFTLRGAGLLQECWRAGAHGFPPDIIRAADNARIWKKETSWRTTLNFT